MYLHNLPLKKRNGMQVHDLVTEQLIFIFKSQESNKY